MTINILDKLEKQLSKYVRGWLFDALFVGVLTALGLSILKINNAVMIGTVAALGHLIPYAGPIVGGIPLSWQAPGNSYTSAGFRRALKPAPRAPNRRACTSGTGSVH